MNVIRTRTSQTNGLITVLFEFYFILAMTDEKGESIETLFT